MRSTEEFLAVAGTDLYFDLSDLLYVARTGAACVDAGRRLQPFMQQLTAAWEAGGDDVAVWMLSEGCRCRLVAVLRDSPGGDPIITWL
jgi:hypothetical protein